MFVLKLPHYLNLGASRLAHHNPPPGKHRLAVFTGERKNGIQVRMIILKYPYNKTSIMAWDMMQLFDLLIPFTGFAITMSLF